MLNLMLALSEMFGAVALCVFVILYAIDRFGRK